VERSVTDVDGRLVVTSPKNHHSREVPVPAFLVAMLMVYVAGRAPDEPLFPAPGGGVLRGNNFRRRFSTAPRPPPGCRGSRLTNSATRRPAWRSGQPGLT
jgi:hypothetical protein